MSLFSGHVTLTHFQNAIDYFRLQEQNYLEEIVCHQEKQGILLQIKLYRSGQKTNKKNIYIYIQKKTILITQTLWKVIS